MAYKNLLNVALNASSEIEWCMRMRDFVVARSSSNGWDYSTTGIGWTLHDGSYASGIDAMAINDWFVVKSVGEYGHEQMYFKITLIDNYINIQGWQYWNETTHAGSGTNWTRGNSMAIGPNPEYIWIYGDLDFVHLVAVGIDTAPTNWYCGAFGCLNTNHLIPLEGMNTPRNVQETTGAVSSGSGVSITVGNSSSDLWRVGCNLMIMDNSNFEMITVLSNNGSGTITANLVNAYSAGAKVAVNLPYFVVGANTTHFYLAASGACVLHDMGGNHAGGLNEPVAIAVIGNATILNLNIGTGWDLAYSLQPYAVYDATYGLLGMIPHSGYTLGTGLTNFDVLDDVTDPDVQWRYVSTTNARCYKEV